MNNDEEAKAALKELGATYCFKLTGDEESVWTLNLSELTLTSGEPDGDDEADCTLSLSGDDFLQMVNGEVQGQALFMQGLIMLEGDFTLALQLEQVFGAAE